MQKKEYIEWLRIVAMCAVVFTHIGSTASTDFPETYFGSVGGAVFQSIVYLSHFAVPVFFMITGALLLNPQKDMPLPKIIKKYVGRYCAVIVIFGWVYALLEQVFVHGTINLTIVVRAFIDMLEGNTWEHMWYMYTLVGMMLILPVMRAMIKTFSEVSMYYMFGILFIFLSIFPTVEHLTGFKVGIVFPIASIYFMYMIMGRILDENEFRINNVWLVAFVIICSVVFVVNAVILIRTHYNYGLGKYTSPVVVVYSAAIFTLFKRIDFKTNKLTCFLSSVSFGVYLVHMFWINMAFKFFGINPIIPTPFTGVCVALGTLILSVLTTMVLKKMPIMKKLI